MGRMQLLVLSQPRNGSITNLEDAVRRSLEAAPLRFVDAVVLIKQDNDTIEFAAVSDIALPDRMWRGLLAQALFGNETVGIAPWTLPDPPDEPDAMLDLKEVHLLEISDRIPRNSASLLVLVEHHWMDELSDEHIAPGHLVANGWISTGALVALGKSQPQRWPS